MKPPALSLVLPVHNEADIIQSVYMDVREMLRGLRVPFEIILVENGSSDASPGVLKRLAKTHPDTSVLVAPRGYGSAVLAGLARAKGMYVSYMPSDGQIDLAVFPEVWRLSQTGQWDMVKVKRVTRETWARTVTSRAFSLIMTVLFGIPLYDINGSPRIMLRSKLAGLGLTYTDSFLDAEMVVKATRLGWRIREIPMKTLSRLGGVSTRSAATFIEFFKNIWDFRIQWRI